MEARNKGSYRSNTPRLWQTMLASAVLFAVLVLATSSWSKGEDSSPEALLKKAREHMENQEFEKAQECYAKVIEQREPIPAVFLDAEKEINTARLKALEARRKAAQAEKEQATGGQAPDGQTPGPETPDTPVNTGGQETPPEPLPDVNLPELPDFGGGL